MASQVRTRGLAEEGAAGWGWREETRELDLIPGGGWLVWEGSSALGVWGAVLLEIQGPLAPSPSAPHRSQPHLEELWNVRMHLVKAQVAVRGADPVGRGSYANPPGRSGLVPGMCPNPGLSAPMLRTEAALCSRMAGEGAGGC